MTQPTECFIPLKLIPDMAWLILTIWFMWILWEVGFFKFIKDIIVSIIERR